MTRATGILSFAGLLVLSWLVMQIVHEAGHVAGAHLTGGHVSRVVLHPLAISRTDVSPNPVPAVVVWMGPVTGMLLPVMLWGLMKLLAGRLEHLRRWNGLTDIMLFFAGFCLIANGAYLLFGTPDHVGDCGEMLRTGTPASVIYAAGGIAVLIGFWCWHRLGSPLAFLKSPQRSFGETAAIFAATLLVIAAELWWAW